MVSKITVMNEGRNVSVEVGGSSTSFNTNSLVMLGITSEGVQLLFHDTKVVVLPARLNAQQMKQLYNSVRERLRPLPITALATTDAISIFSLIHMSSLTQSGSIARVETCVHTYTNDNIGTYVYADAPTGRLCSRLT